MDMLIYRELEAIKYEINELKKLLETNGMSDKWMSLSEAQDYTGLSQSTLRRLIAKWQLRASRQVGKVLLKRSEIDKFLNKGV